MGIGSVREEGTLMSCCLEWIMVQVFRGMCFNADQNKSLYDLWPDYSISRILFPVYLLKFSYQNIYKSTYHNNKKTENKPNAQQ